MEDEEWEGRRIEVRSRQWSFRVVGMSVITSEHAVLWRFHWVLST